MTQKQKEEHEAGAKTKIFGFLHDVRSEFWKISWPVRKELLSTTWIVAVVILILAAIVFVYDQALVKVLNWVMGAR